MQIYSRTWTYLHKKIYNLESTRNKWKFKKKKKVG